MRTFYVVFNKDLNMKELKTEASRYIERVGAIVTNKNIKQETNSKVTIGDVMYSPEHGFNWEIVVIK